MDKKFGICVCLAVGLLKTLIAADVDDPCKAVNTESKVATMCKETSGTEEIYNGLINVDSVVLRVQTQAENCICRVSIFNQTSERRLYVRKFNDLTSSAPTNADCGLYIDAYFTGQSSNQLTSFMCSNSILFNTFIKPNSELEFNSRLAYGSFISGYCIEVYKDYSSSSQDELRIKCDLKRDEAILNTTIESTTSSTTIVLTTAYAGDLRQSEVQHTTDSSGTTNDATSIKPLTDNIEKNATMYIVIGGCGGLLMILIPFIIAIVYKRYAIHSIS